MQYPPSIFIQAIGLLDAWGQAVRKVMDCGMVIQTQYGPSSRDVCSMIEITHPYESPMLHPDFPTKELHTQEYIKQWFRGYDWIAQGFEYNYMDRLTHYPKTRTQCDDDMRMAKSHVGKDGLDLSKHYYNNSPNIMYAIPCTDTSSPNFIDQIERIRSAINKGVSRRVQAITWVPGRDLFVDEDQPCLQRLWVRNLGNGNCELHVMWRSRDLYAAWFCDTEFLKDIIGKEPAHGKECTDKRGDN